MQTQTVALRTEIMESIVLKNYAEVDFWYVMCTYL